MAATAWWAFTTRRVWKRWLNIAIAALAVANIVLGFLEFGFRQATGALAIVTGALLYATATPRALRTTPGPVPRPGVAGPAAPWLLVNPRSGDGKAGRVGLVEAARGMGVRCTCWRRGTTRGRWPGRRWRVGRTRSGWPAGTGRWGWWRRWRWRPGCRSCACPRGPGTTSPGTWGWTGATRWPRWRPFAGPERRVDVAMVGDRMFVNNVSLGRLRRPGRRPPLPGGEAGHRPRRPAGVAARRAGAAAGRPAGRRRPRAPGRAGAAGGLQRL